jgi:hypothetical protein
MPQGSWPCRLWGVALRSVSHEGDTRCDDYPTHSSRARRPAAHLSAVRGGGAPYATSGPGSVQAPYGAWTDRRVQDRTAPQSTVRHRKLPQSTLRNTVRAPLLLTAPGHRASCRKSCFQLPAAINYCSYVISTPKSSQGA